MHPEHKSGIPAYGRTHAFGLLAAVLLIPFQLFGAPRPSWWSDPSVTASGSAAVINPAATPSDYSAVNQGQVKNIAVAAIHALNTGLAQFQPASPDLTTLAASLSATNSSTNDYAAANLGQVKTILKPMYDRLLAVGYTLGPLTSGTYPWVGATRAASDYSAVNIGQIKNAFNFDVTQSTDGSGLPDWWEDKYYPGANPDPNALAAAADGYTILQEYLLGRDPLPSVQVIPPSIAKTGGDNQLVLTNSLAALPLTVRVTDHNNLPLSNASVTFAVSAGGGAFSSDAAGDAASSTLTVASGSDGSAQVFFQASAGTGITSITATILSGTAASPSATFSETVTAPISSSPSPTSPSNVVSQLNSDGSVDVTWSNNTTNETSITISVQNSDGTWTSATVPPQTTSYHFPPQ